MSKIYPPIGFTIPGEGYIDSNNEKELREFALSMSDDPAFKAKIATASKEDLILFFKENGFEFED